MKNKGFSLVELIIVIAIMAILAAAIAPALIRYIDKSRRADDVTAAGTVESAVLTAIANEKAYDEAVPGSDSSLVVSASKTATSAAGTVFSSEIVATLGQGVDIKYTKKDANAYNAYITADGSVEVYIGKAGAPQKWMIRPVRTEDYN